MPSVFVENVSGEQIEVVEVKLPNNKLVFENIEPGSVHQIYYSLAQNDGVYAYRVVFEDGIEKNVECGNVTPNEIGKTHRLTIRSSKVLSCNGKDV